MTHRYRHDFSFLNSNFAQCVAGFFDQWIEDTWCELEVLEKLAQLVEFFERDFVLAPFLGQDFFGLNPLLAELFEAFFGFHGIWPRLRFFIVCTSCLVGCSNFRCSWYVVGGIQVTHHDVTEAALFARDSVVLC